MLSKTLGQILVKGEKEFNLSPFAFYKIKNAFEALIKEPLILKETDASLDVLKRQLKKELKKIYLDEYETKFHLLLSFFNPVSEDFFKTHALKEGMDNSPLLDDIFKVGYFTSYLDEDKLKKNYKFIFDQCEPNLKITINNNVYNNFFLYRKVHGQPPYFFYGLYHSKSIYNRTAYNRLMSFSSFSSRHNRVTEIPCRSTVSDMKTVSKRLHS